ncbi:MAG: thiamine phosphate synthase [Gammaproteobacteria bacterium]|nr:MAG: thiamine phosphate synthase [Gammaproteobacteria bacterium]
MTKAIIRGLYAITQVVANDEERLYDNVAAALRGGARFIQYRDKVHNGVKRQRIGHRLLMLCREYGATLIINDDIALCLAIGAGGVHLGKGDANINTARAQLGETKIIGVSCYNQLQLAVQAQQDGADYVAFGSFYNSSTKPDAVAAPLSLLTEARMHVTVPIVAIGGITVDNGQPLITAGADALAVINGIFGEDDIKAAAQTFSDYFLD